MNNGHSNSPNKDSKTAFIVSLTTDPDNLSSMKFLKTYFNSTICKNITNKKEHHVEYDRQINDETIQITFREIKAKEESYASISNKVDCFILIINIESISSLNSLDFLITFLKDLGNERRCYILGFYENQANIHIKLKEENLIAFLDTKQIDFDYIDVNKTDNSSQVKILDFITQETIQKKQKRSNNAKHSELIVDIDNSKSICTIF